MIIDNITKVLYCHLSLNIDIYQYLCRKNVKKGRTPFIDN